jgi:hypothetical protein
MRHIATMPKPEQTKDKRVSVIVPPEMEKDYAALVAKLRTTKGGLAELAVRFAVPRIKSGKLVSLNGDLVEAAA